MPSVFKLELQFSKSVQNKLKLDIYIAKNTIVSQCDQIKKLQKETFNR